MSAVRTRKRAGSPAPGALGDSSKKPSASASRDDGSGSDGRYRVRRFDADRKDRELTLREALDSRPTERQLLWIDVAGEIEDDELEALVKRFGLEDQTRDALAQPIAKPHIAVHGKYVHVSVGADPASGAPRERPWLDIVGGRNVVITRHVGGVEVLDEVDDRIKADTTLGAAEGAEFVAIILDGVLTGYFNAVDVIEDEIDRLDARSLGTDGRHELLDDLIRLRRRIARLRRTVTGHRSVFAALSGPEVRQIADSADAASDLQATAARYEAAVGAVESSREALLGSFDVYMTRTAQRTNDVMKILTIATVLLLPGTVVAGFLGMNVIVPLNKDDPVSFWIVVGAVGLLAVVVLGLARARRWI